MLSPPLVMFLFLLLHLCHQLLLIDQFQVVHLLLHVQSLPRCFMLHGQLNHSCFYIFGPLSICFRFVTASTPVTLAFSVLFISIVSILCSL